MGESNYFGWWEIKWKLSFEGWIGVFLEEKFRYFREIELSIKILKVRGEKFVLYGDNK